MDEEHRLQMKQEHFDKYARLTAELGLHNLISLIPASRERIVAALAAGDEHLNTIPLALWDKAVGYGVTVAKHRPCSDCPIRDAEKNADPRPLVFRRTSLSVSERCSLLKHVATYHVAKQATTN